MQQPVQFNIGIHKAVLHLMLQGDLGVACLSESIAHGGVHLGGVHLGVLHR